MDLEFPEHLLMVQEVKLVVEPVWMEVPELYLADIQLIVVPQLMVVPVLVSDIQLTVVLQLMEVPVLVSDIQLTAVPVLMEVP